MKHRLKGLLALVLSLTMVLGLMTCAWGAKYTVSTNQLDYNGTVYEPLQEGQLLFAGDEIIEDPYVSGGYFVIWNGTEYESLGSSNEVFYDDSNSQKNYLDPALYCERSYTIPSGKYIFREFGEAFLNHNNQGTDPLYYYDTREWANYPVSYIHLVPVYTVTYDLQDHGTMTTATQTDIPKGDKVTEPNPAPTEAGWTFGGWYEDAACSNAYDFTSAVHSSFTLYAKWTENSLPAQYTVKFNANGGSGTMNDATVVSGNYTLPANGFTAPAGNEFIGWSVDPAGAERMRPGEQMQITKDTTLYAIWKSTGGNGGQGPSIPAPYPPYTPTPEPEVTAPKTFDSGVALHIGLTILAASGSAWLAKKKD